MVKREFRPMKIPSFKVLHVMSDEPAIKTGWRYYHNHVSWLGKLLCFLCPWRDSPVVGLWLSGENLPPIGTPLSQALGSAYFIHTVTREQLEESFNGPPLPPDDFSLDVP